MEVVVDQLAPAAVQTAQAAHMQHNSSAHKAVHTSFCASVHLHIQSVPAAGCRPGRCPPSSPLRLLRGGGSTEGQASAGVLWVPDLIGMLQNLARMIVLQHEGPALSFEPAVGMERVRRGLAARPSTHASCETWECPLRLAGAGKMLEQKQGHAAGSDLLGVPAA